MSAGVILGNLKLEMMILLHQNKKGEIQGKVPLRQIVTEVKKKD
jgi:hypothetical protein